MEERIRNLRLECDKLSGVMEYYITSSDNLYASQNSLLFAKAWLGKMLGAMGVDSPYQNDGKRNVVEDIEPTADRHTLAEGENYVDSDMSYIAIIDKLRQDIAGIAKDVESITSSKGGRKSELMKENVYTELCEARFYLGFELERIKKAADGNDQEG